MEHISALHNNFAFLIDRVTVVLGANGSGKSRLLTEFKDSISITAGPKSVVYVEGGRAISFEDVLKIDRNNFNQYENLNKAADKYGKLRIGKLVPRLHSALLLLLKQGQEIRNLHSDAVEDWVESGKNGPCPRREQAPLDLLFEQFNEIFSKLTLQHDKETGSLTATKDAVPYNISFLSDGEKQSLALLADFLKLEDSYKYVIVDEPEINLHPELAERLWSYLESEYPNITFLYATHSINFALRPNVESIYVISDSIDRTKKVKDIQDIDRSEIRKFLGGLPGILSTNTAIITEGDEKSFDSLFYKWLIEDNSIEIYPAGGCQDVKKVVEKSGLWTQISSGVTLIGIVDGDYRSRGYLDRYTHENIIVLTLHEAESYLCHPNVLIALADHLGIVENMPTEEKLSEMIIAKLDSSKLKIAAKRLFTQCEIRLGVSLHNSILSNIRTEEDLDVLFRDASNEQLAFAKEKIGEETIKSIFKEELSKIGEIVEEKNVLNSLSYLPGKDLINELIILTGYRNAHDLIRSLRHNFKPEDFSHLKELSETIKAKVT